MKSFAIAVALLAAPPPASSPEAVVHAERAFAAEVSAKGFKKGFLAFAADDAVLFQPGVVNARASLGALPDAPPENPPLDWWPEWAGMAASGDFGFTTGPASIPVRYFTVWRKQADGSWKWIYDGGPGLRELMPGGASVTPSYLPASTAGTESAKKALAEIAPLETRLALASTADARRALAALLAPEALVASSGHAGAAGQEHQAAALAARPASLQLHPLKGEASSAGDMAFTYGDARWTRDDQPRWGHYVRIWQKRTEGWRLVVDMLLAAPGAPPARG